MFGMMSLKTSVLWFNPNSHINMTTMVSYEAQKYDQNIFVTVVTRASQYLSTIVFYSIDYSNKNAVSNQLAQKVCIWKYLWNKDEISLTPLFSCFFLEQREYRMSIFGICFILYFLKLSACCGFRSTCSVTFSSSN